MLSQVTVETVSTKKNLNIEKYQHVLNQSSGYISPTCILLDNQSRVYALFIRHTKKTNRELAIFSTGGQTTTYLKGDLPIYGTVRFHPGDISNILSLSKAVKKYCVAYDSTGEDNSWCNYQG